jgi:hypothetical protein
MMGMSPAAAISSCLQRLAVGADFGEARGIETAPPTPRRAVRATVRSVGSRLTAMKAASGAGQEGDDLRQVRPAIPSRFGLTAWMVPGKPS